MGNEMEWTKHSHGYTLLWTRISALGFLGLSNQVFHFLVATGHRIPWTLSWTVHRTGSRNCYMLCDVKENRRRKEIKPL